LSSVTTTVADLYRHVVGVDTHAATHSFAIVAASNGALVDQAIRSVLTPRCLPGIVPTRINSISHSSRWRGPGALHCPLPSPLYVASPTSACPATRPAHTCISRSAPEVAGLLPSTPSRGWPAMARPPCTGQPPTPVGVRRDRQPTYVPTDDLASLTPSHRERHCAHKDAVASTLKRGSTAPRRSATGRSGPPLGLDYKSAGRQPYAVSAISSPTRSNPP
jgi:hypothetical protein